MKKITFLLMVLLLIAMPSSAQHYTQSRYYNKQTGHLDYGRHDNDFPDSYFGFRIGPSFSYVNSDDSRLDGGNWQTGLNVGVVAGVALSNAQPLYLEGGLFYTEKGGKKNLANGKKMTYDLNYIEIPLVLKYKFNHLPDNIHPKIHAGQIVSGEWFVDSKEKMRSILEHFPHAMAVDMESCSIAQTCHIYKTPFISFRIISDVPLKDTKAQQYFDFWAKMAEGSFNVTKAFLEKL